MEVTCGAVYIHRVSPERLFTDLCTIETDMLKLEKLASVTGLDVRHLCMVMASHHVAQTSLQYAHDLLALAGVGILHV